MDWLANATAAFSNFVWGMPMIVLLVGCGCG